MITQGVFVAAGVVGSAVVAAVLLARLVVPAIPEPPAGTPDLESKAPYRDLPTRGFVASCAAVAAVVAGVAVVLLPVWVWPLWWCVATIGVVTAAVDAVTTWLPTVLARAGTVAGALGVFIGAVALGGTWTDVAQVVAGGLLVGALFLALALFADHGMGDARFGPLVGAAMGSLGLGAVLGGLILGLVAVVVWGVVQRRVTGRRFVPFGPGLVIGVVAVAIATIPLNAAQ